MKKLNNKGFSFVELLLAVSVTMITLSVILFGQRTSLKKNASANHLNVATQIIEKQIENRRLKIALNPDVNYPKFKALSDTTIIDSSVKPPVNVKWVMKAETDPRANKIDNVCRVTLFASWGTQKDDSLQVETCVGKNF